MPSPAAKPAEPSLFRRRLTMSASSIREEDRSFEAVIATEEPVPVFDARRGRSIDEVLLADGAEFAEQVPLLNDHQRDKLTDVMGRMDPPRREGNRWVARSYVSKAAHTEPVWELIRDGSFRGVSIGYRPLEYVDIAPGQSRNIGGRLWRAEQKPLRITTRYQVFELSLTPVGADSRTYIRSVSRTTFRGRLPAPPARRTFR